jgi:hypothetical protein
LKHYLAMAEASPRISASVPQPYAYRLLGPYIAGLLPLPTSLSFYLLAVAASAALVILFYHFLCFSGIGSTAAMVTAILFMFNKYFIGFTLWDYFQLNDILSLLALLFSVWTMYKGSWGSFAIALLLGVLCRETKLMMLPISLVYLLEVRKTVSNFRKWLPAVILPAAAFLAIRFIVTPAGGSNLCESFVRHAPRLASPGSWFGLTVSGFIPLSLLPLIYWKDTVAFFRERVHLLFLAGLVFVAALFGSNNERLMAPAFIVFYPLIARIIQKSFMKSKALLILIIAVSFVSSFDFMSGTIRLPERNEAMILAIVCLVTVTLIAAIFRIREKREGVTA